jgi:hypothetical protein
MRHELLTQRALFCIDVMAKRVALSQHVVTHVVPPLGSERCTLLKAAIFAHSLITSPSLTHSPPSQSDTHLVSQCIGLHLPIYF